MNKKLFYNNWLFRMAAPPLFGLLIYLMVLLFFGPAEMVFENFFSSEVLFIILLTFLFFELNRLVIVVLNKILPFETNIRFRIIIQFFLSFLFSVIVISSVLFGYFTFVEGFNTISTELYTFNAIYLLTAVFYHLYFISIMFMHIRNDARISEEIKKKENLLLEVESFKNQIDPHFLFRSLEIILSELYHDKKQADDLVELLAQTYRYRLDNRQNEMIPLLQEIESLNPLLKLYRVKYGAGLNLKTGGELNESVQVIPGSLQMIMEQIIRDSIITPSLPLDITLVSKNNNVTISYPDQHVLETFSANGNYIEGLNRIISYFSGNTIRRWTENNIIYIEIPLVVVDEE